MSTATRPLVAGESLTRAEFHERYEATPDVKFELIEGVVYMASPLGWKHGIIHALGLWWVGTYRAFTRGVEVLDNASAALDAQSEVQPDISVRIAPGWGGQTRNLGAIIGGAPEMVIEVADSSRWIDLGPKLRDYERNHVLEYIVFVVEPFEVYWHAQRDGKLIRIPPDADGLYRSVAFPGLWLDPIALRNDDGPALLATLQRGLATPEYAAFGARLAGHVTRGDNA